MSAEILVCVATDLEGAWLREHLEGRDGIRVIATGVGAVNAAHAVTLELVRARPSAVVVCGVGGAYPGSGLRIGDVVCASQEIYGDLGATSPTRFLDLQALGFPTVPGPTPLYNTFPMHLFPTHKQASFVTMNACTGTDASARLLEARTGGGVENMEGAAVAHVAHLHGVPVGEVRGISNMVGDRDTSTWRLAEAALAAQEALFAWISQQ